MTYRVLSVEALLSAGASAGPVLGIETGTRIASFGVVRDGRIAAVLEREASSHGGDLPVMVTETLKKAGLEIGDLAGVAVGIGPGSFTGLRIGLSYAKGLGMGAKTAILGVRSLDALALCGVNKPGLQPGIEVCPVIDAHRGEVYASLYRIVGDALENELGGLVVPLDDLVERIAGNVLFIGDSKAEEACRIADTHGRGASYAGAAELRHRGSFVAALGAMRLAQHDVDEAATLEPLYVRAPGATLKSTAVNPGEGTRHGSTRGRVDPAVCSK